VSPKRRRKSARSRGWLWALGAAVGALVAYFFVAHRGSGSKSIPLPGESMEPAASEPAAAPAPPSERPREEIHDSERKALDKVLREHAR